MKRAVHLHNNICGLLLTSYENLQDHINKLSVHLNEFEKKKLNLGLLTNLNVFYACLNI